jgi:Protein of unknown function (DUF2846)
MKVRIALLLVIAGALLANAQEPKPQPADNAKATVYVYRLKLFYAKLLKPSVYCDSKDLGRIENGRFMKLEIDPGKHYFRSNDKESGFEADLKPGQQYYIRIDMVPTAMHGHGRVLLVAPEQGTEEITKVTRQ